MLEHFLEYGPGRRDDPVQFPSWRLRVDIPIVFFHARMRLQRQ
jgi:hypothetical protein